MFGFGKVDIVPVSDASKSTAAMIYAVGFILSPLAGCIAAIALMFMAKGDRFIRFYALQYILTASIVSVAAILCLIAMFFLRFIGQTFVLLMLASPFLLFVVFYLLFTPYSIIAASKGFALKLPLISNLVLKFA